MRSLGKQLEETIRICGDVRYAFIGCNSLLLVMHGFRVRQGKKMLVMYAGWVKYGVKYMQALLQIVCCRAGRNYELEVRVRGGSRDGMMDLMDGLAMEMWTRSGLASNEGWSNKNRQPVLLHIRMQIRNPSIIESLGDSVSKKLAGSWDSNGEGRRSGESIGSEKWTIGS